MLIEPLEQSRHRLASEDVARVIAAMLDDCDRPTGKIYELTEPRS